MMPVASVFGDEIVSNSTAAKACRCLLVAFLLALPAMADNSPRPGLPKPITTRQRLFAIPFYLNPNSRTPQRIALFVSGDKGQAWTLYQRRTAADQKFDFHAGEDGEYWFVVRTAEQAPPHAATLPEKIVVVDQHKPDLKMAIELGPSGLLQARWTVKDPNLDAKTFRLEYQQSDDDRWRPVTVSIPAGEASTSYVGEVSWVPSRAGDVLVRAEVLDSAGNAAVFEERIRAGAARAPSGRTAAARTEPTTTAVVDPPVTQTPIQSGDLSYPKPASPRTAPSQLGWRTTAPDRIAQTSPIDSDPRVDPSTTGFGFYDPVVHPLDSVSRATVGNTPVQGEYLPPVASQVSPEPSPNRLSRPVRRQIQMTNSRRFNLDYDVADAGDSGVARVELWITEDEGRSWKAHGTDADKTSPFLVELNREGTYGFRLLIQNNLGASAGPPQPGDAADLWVGVDVTQPQAQITSARLGTGSQTGLLEIRWAADDLNLPDQPIRLSYAERVAGPWMPVVEPLSNSGFYEWRIPEKLADWVYLRIDVTDRAGNTTRAQLPNPISTSPVPPSGRIRAISPIGLPEVGSQGR